MDYLPVAFLSGRVYVPVACLSHSYRATVRELIEKLYLEVNADCGVEGVA